LFLFDSHLDIYPQHYPPEAHSLETGATQHLFPKAVVLWRDIDTIAGRLRDPAATEAGISLRVAG